MTRATHDSWKTLALPTKKEPLGFEALYTDSDADQMMAGLVPQAMEDKWFIYFNEGWLYFHRSWSGACIYGLRLDGSPAGVRVVESWVSRDLQQYKGDDLEYDRKFIRFLIDAFLLQKPAEFPLPQGQSHSIPGVFQHHAVGRAFKETTHQPRRNPDGFWFRITRLFKGKK